MSEYHDAGSCNKCAGENTIKIVDTCDGFMSECETECVKCGHKDYWAYGYFESGAEMESKCKKYTTTKPTQTTMNKNINRREK